MDTVKFWVILLVLIMWSLCTFAIGFFYGSYRESINLVSVVTADKQMFVDGFLQLASLERVLESEKMKVVKPIDANKLKKTVASSVKK